MASIDEFIPRIGSKYPLVLDEFSKGIIEDYSPGEIEEIIESADKREELPSLGSLIGL